MNAATKYTKGYTLIDSFLRPAVMANKEGRIVGSNSLFRELLKSGHTGETPVSVREVFSSLPPSESFDDSFVRTLNGRQTLTVGPASSQVEVIACVIDIKAEPFVLIVLAGIDDLQTEIESLKHQYNRTRLKFQSFLHSISHDLKAPLRALIGNADVLEEDYATDIREGALDRIRRIRFNAARMQMMIEALVAFFRMSNKKLSFSPINTDHLVSVILRENNILSNSKFKVTLNKLPETLGDIELVQLIWRSLVLNAVKFSAGREVSKIAIGSADQKDEIIYHISDNGVGFDMNYAERLFSIFQRLHRDGEFDGIGAGLALTHQAIAMHGGRIWADARIDEGATFYFSMPKQPVPQSAL